MCDGGCGDTADTLVGNSSMSQTSQKLKPQKTKASRTNNTSSAFTSNVKRTSSKVIKGGKTIR